MPKPVPLTPEHVTAEASHISSKAASTQKVHQQIPLQVRLPRDEVRKIKIAAAEHEQTVSDFMLACFHAYMKGAGKA